MTKKRFIILAVLAGMYGSVLTGILMFHINAQYDDMLADQIVTKVINEEMSDNKKVLTLLHTTHDLLEPRFSFFRQAPFLSLRDTIFRSLDIELIAPKGACGSHAVVLGRLLQRSGFPVRIAQMLCSSLPGGACHVLVEVQLNGKWVVLDALYDLYFKNKEGGLASFKDVSENWPFFNSQVPSYYNQIYSYEAVRYTNWQKVPVIMPMMKSILHQFIGDKVEKLSIRSYTLNTYRAYEVFLVLVLLFLLVPSTYWVWKSK